MEIREKAVDEQGGITQANQRIIYDKAGRDKCLLEIAKAVGV